jgi:hypothetical protein
MFFPRPSTPAAAWRDLRSFMATRRRYHLLFALLAILMPVIIVYGFYRDAAIKPEPQIVYVQSWPESRTDEEIKAQQKIDQAKRDKAMAEKRAQYQRLADQLGIE